MTGRRLYELLCDAHEESGDYWRAPERDDNLLDLPVNLPAWPFLSSVEKRKFTRVALRLKGVKR